MISKSKKEETYINNDNLKIVRPGKYFEILETPMMFL